MNRALLSLAVLLAVLVAWERSLARGAVSDRAEKSRVGRLLTEEEREGLPIAAVRIEGGSGTSYVYGRVEGRWVCLDYHRAPADPSAIAQLVDGLTRTDAVAHSEDGDDAAKYGIGTSETIRVSLCGSQVLSDPSFDVLEAFDVGKSIAGRDGAFVRRLGHAAIWAVDADTRRLLIGDARRRVPPLLDPGVLPRGWPGWESGVERVFVDRANATGFQLLRRPVELDPAALAAGRKPWVWILDPGPEEQMAGELPAYAYSLFLQRATFTGMLPAETIQGDSFAEDTWVVTLFPAAGDPLELTFGAPLADGSVPVWNPWAKCVYVVPNDVARLLAPERSLFRPDSEENPWDPYLR